MANVFISYSRKDKEAALKLASACKARELEVWIDSEAIEPTVDWWNEVEKGIEGADNFLFLISPDSASSPVCKRELEHAIRNGKRLIPVVTRTTKSETVASELRSLNWIYLREEDDFESALETLLKAINTDYAWVQVHRQLQVKALEWERSGRKKDFVLQGEELQEAESYLATNSSKDPHPTDLQREYVLSSRQVSDRQRVRNTSIATLVIIILGVLTVVATVQSRLAQKAQATAETNASIAMTNETEAQRQANIALSRQLTARAQTELLGNQDRRLSLLFAMEAINAAKNAPGFRNIAAEQVLRDAIYQTGGEVLVSPVGDRLQNTRTGSASSTVVKALSPTGNLLAIVYEDHTVHVWDLLAPDKSPVILTASDPAAVHELLFDPKERFLVELKETGGVEIWDLKNKALPSHVFKVNLADIPLSNSPGDPTFSPDGEWLALRCVEKTGSYTTVLNLLDLDKQPMNFPGAFRVAPGVQDHWLIAVEDKETGASTQLWDLSDPEKGPIALPQGYYCSEFDVSPDGQWLVTHCSSGYSLLWNIQDIIHPRAPLKTFPNYFLEAFSADSSQLAVITDTDTIKLLDLQPSGNVSAVNFFGRGEQLRDLKFSPDGRTLAASRGGKSILLWDLASQKSLPLTLNGLGGIESAVEYFEFAPDRLHLISVSDDGVARKWDLLNPYSASLSLNAKVDGIPYIDDVSFSSDGRWLAVNDAEDYDATPYSTLVDLKNFSAGPIQLTPADGYLLFRPNGDQVISVSAAENKIYRWNLADIAEGRFHPSSLDVPGKIIASSLHLENRWLISQLEDNTIRVWDLFQPGEKPKSVLTNQTLIEDWTRVFTNGKWFWMIGKDNSVQLWDLDHPDQKPESLPSVSKELYTIKISPRGNWLAVTDKKNTHLWDLRKSAREPILSLQADTDAGFGINAHDEIIFSSDEHQLIISQGTKIQILNLQDLAAEPITLEGVVQEMQKIALSSDDHWLASNTARVGEIRLWNLQDLTSAPIVLHQEKSMNAFHFSPDGKWLAVADESNLRLLRLDIREVSNLACAIIGSNLSSQQWKENFPADKKYERTCSQWPEGKDKIVLITTG